jgi:hypothetical protein
VRRLWVLAISDRQGFKFPPEVYRSRQQAIPSLALWIKGLSRDRKNLHEALAADDQVHAIRVGNVYCAVVPALVDDVAPHDELWIGGVFSAAGLLVDGPTIHRHQGQARGWVTSQGSGDPKAQTAEKPGDDTTCVFKKGSRRLLSTATRAKVVAPYASIVTADLPEIVQPSTYTVEIAATYTHAIETSFEALPGLTREAIESRIDEEFPHLGAQRGMLIDLSWDLESFEERPGLRWRIQPKEDDPEEPRPQVERDR